MFELNEVEYFFSGYQRDKGLPPDPYRLMTLEEAIARKGDRVHISDHNGQARMVKITSVKTWKTRPGEAIVGWKYGLRDYGQSDFHGGKPTSFYKLLVKLDGSNGRNA